MILEGTPCLLRLGDIINLGNGPAIVTVIMPILFTYRIFTTRGEVELNFLTQMLIYRPDKLSRQLQDTGVGKTNKLTHNNLGR